MAPKDPGRDLVADLLRRRYGLEVEEIPRDSLAGPTPDLRVRRGEADAFVVEVKTLTYSRPKVAAEEGNMRSYPDRAATRIGALIVKAAKQLRGCAPPRVLAIVNEDIYNVHDLDAAVSGGFEASVGGGSARIHVMGARPVALGKLRVRFREIDLVLWIEGLRPGPAGELPVLMRAATELGIKTAVEFLGAAPGPWPGIRYDPGQAIGHLPTEGA